MNYIIKLGLLLTLIVCGFVHVQETGTTHIRYWKVDGVLREAMVYVPVKSNQKPPPVIFIFHGHRGDMREEFHSHHFEQLWPEAIIIVPQGLNTPGQLVDRAGNFPGWQQAPGDMYDRDIHFFDEIVRSLREDYKIDEKRIYATGHSNGGSFTYLLCAMRGDVLAAVAPSAAGALRFSDKLKPKPVLHIMGEEDALVKPEWQKMTFNKMLNLNQCNSIGRPYAEFATWYPSQVNAPAVLYAHPGGHIYPEGANAVVIRFFKSIVKL